MNRTVYPGVGLLLVFPLALLWVAQPLVAQIVPPPPANIPPECFTGQLDPNDAACQGRGATGYMTGLQNLTDQIDVRGDKLLYNFYTDSSGATRAKAVDLEWAICVYNNNGGIPISNWIWHHLTPSQRAHLQKLWNAHRKIMGAAVKVNNAQKKKDDCAKKLAELKAKMDAKKAAYDTAQGAADAKKQAGKDARARQEKAQKSADAYMKQWKTGTDEILPNWAKEFGKDSNEYAQAKTNVALQLEAAQRWQEEADKAKAEAEKAEGDAKTDQAKADKAKGEYDTAKGAYDEQAKKCKKAAAALDAAKKEFDDAVKENPDAEDWDDVSNAAGSAAGDNARKKAEEEARKKREKAEADARAAAQAEKDRLKAQEEARKRQQEQAARDLAKFLEFVAHVRKHAGDSAADSLLDPWSNAKQDALFGFASAIGDAAKAGASGTSATAGAASSLAASGISLGYAFLVNYTGSKIQKAGAGIIMKQIAAMASHMMTKGQSAAVIKGDESKGQTQMTYIYKYPDGSIVAFHYSKSSGLVTTHMTAHEIVKHGGSK